MNEKIKKIIDILNKHGFDSSITVDVVNAKEKVIQEMMDANLNEIADALVEYTSCIKDIIKVVYDKE